MLQLWHLQGYPIHTTCSDTCECSYIEWADPGYAARGLKAIVLLQRFMPLLVKEAPTVMPDGISCQTADKQAGIAVDLALMH